MNRDDIARTFHLLEAGYGNVRWGARKKDRMEGSYATNAAELVEFAEAYKDWDFYVQLNPSSKLGGRRVSAEDVSEWRWFFVDVDPSPGNMVARIEKWYEVHNILRGYMGKAPEPVVVDSGRGFQLWYPLWLPERGTTSGTKALDDTTKVTTVPPGEDEALVVMDITYRRAIPIAQNYWLKRIASALSPEVGVVDGFPDLPRLARCPGTVNQKTGRVARLTDNGALYLGQEVRHVADLPHRILGYTPNREFIANNHFAARDPIPEGTPWQVASAYMTGTAAAFLSAGATEPGRHNAAVHTARTLAELGYLEPAIVEALAYGGALSRPALDDHLYFERTAREAVERARRQGVGSLDK